MVVDSQGKWKKGWAKARLKGMVYGERNGVGERVNVLRFFVFPLNFEF